MIEKFTKEEIEIIKEELKNLPKDHQKRSVCHDSFMGLRKELKKQEDYTGIFNLELEDAILLIADHTLCNYEISPRDKKRFRRNNLIPNGMEDDYLLVVNGIIKIIRDNLRTSIKKED